jgi:hypothetical protein
VAISHERHLCRRGWRSGFDDGRLGKRSEAPFVSVNCAGVHANLIDSEIFGHVRGAFTGAVAVVIGYIDRLRIPAQKRYYADFRDCVLETTKVLTRPASNPKRTAFDAESESRQAYRQVERKLRAGSIHDQIIAVRVFRWNARSLQLNPAKSTRTL